MFQPNEFTIRLADNEITVSAPTGKFILEAMTKEVNLLRLANTDVKLKLCLPESGWDGEQIASVHWDGELHSYAVRVCDLDLDGEDELSNGVITYQPDEVMRYVTQALKQVVKDL